MRINSGSNEDLRVRRHTRAFFSKPLENSNQKVLLCLSKTLYYQPQALKLPILLNKLPQGPKLSIILCTLPLFMCRPF